MKEELGSLGDLLDLQAVDLEIDRLLKERQGLPELEQFRKARERLEQLRAQVDRGRGELRGTELAIDKGEGELELSEQKLEIEERRLFAGGIGAREAEHLRQEVEMLQRKTGEMEEQVLALLEVRDDQQQELAQLEKDAEAARVEDEGLERVIGERWRVIDEEIASKEAHKAEIVPRIPGELLELYDRLRASKEGVAVGRLADGVCGGCHLRLSAAEQATALRESPPRCLH
ncbi:MAG: zinc ribbon domain-containing protein, partial [Acidimicrobiia bacterium]